jgi:hypothetical protein
VVGVTDDLSAGGCRLPMAVPPPAGTLVKVRLEFEGADQALIGSARVAWAMPGQPGPPGAPGTLGACGLAFALPLIEATVPLLRRLVDAAPVEVDPAGG